MSVTSPSEELDHLTGSYQLDLVHSRVGFAARHALVARVHGWFEAVDGGLYLDGRDPEKSSVRLTIDAASIRTGNADRDAHLRSADFFDVERYPTISFESTSVRAGRDDRSYRASGNLTIKAKTRSVELDLTYQGNCVDPYGQLRVGIEGSGSVKRSDWGLTWNTALEAGGLVLSDRIDIELDVSAVKVG